VLSPDKRHLSPEWHHSPRSLVTIAAMNADEVRAIAPDPGADKLDWQMAGLARAAVAKMR